MNSPKFKKDDEVIFDDIVYLFVCKVSCSNNQFYYDLVDKNQRIAVFNVHEERIRTNQNDSSKRTSLDPTR